MEIALVKNLSILNDSVFRYDIPICGPTNGTREAFGDFV